MPVSVNVRPRASKNGYPAKLTGILLFLLLTSLAANAAFSVRQMNVRLNKEVLEISGQLDLELSRKTEEALSKGIPLEVIIELQLNRERLLMWDEKLNSWLFKRKIVFHAMSNQYLISSNLPGSETAQESYSSLQGALAAMGSLENVELKLGNSDRISRLIRSTNDPLQLEIRARLDIESLPSPLRPVAYTSRSWRLNSGWSSWSVKQ